MARGLDSRRRLKDVPGHIGGSLQGPAKRGVIIAAHGLDDTGEGLGVGIDQRHTGAAKTPKRAALRGTRDQLLKECGGERCAQRSDTAPSDPGASTGYLLKEFVQRAAQHNPHTWKDGR